MRNQANFLGFTNLERTNLLMPFVTSYNYFVDNGADVDNMFQTIAKDKENEVTIEETNKATGVQFDPRNNTISWSPEWGLDIKLGADSPYNESGEYIEGNQSPAIGLFNEVAGAYVTLYLDSNPEKKKELGIEDLMDEEEWHIDKENEAIDILNSKGYNETKRYDEYCHGCFDRKMSGPTSTTSKKEANKSE